MDGNNISGSSLYVQQVDGGVAALAPLLRWRTRPYSFDDVEFVPAECVACEQTFSVGDHVHPVGPIHANCATPQ
jgi:hypothetical protein